MRLCSLTATFGCLNGDTLDFGPGMTLIGAPNGSGKSTWCAFLRVMLYGLDTRQRDKRGSPADKNRYRPWSGAPMEGLLVCEHEGKRIELRRSSLGGIPMGEFSAVYAGTGRPVPGLTGENAGEFLTGVGREVFDRSVFLRYSSLAVTQSRELEQRIAALVSTGEEEISFSRTEETLRRWQHRRRYHNSGRLPELEAEEEALRETLQETLSLRQELEVLEAQAQELRAEKAHWDSMLRSEATHMEKLSKQRFAQATTELDAAEYKVQSLQAQMADEEALDEEGIQDLEDEIHEIRRGMKGRRTRQRVFTVLALLLTIAAAVLYLLPQMPEAWGLPALMVPSVWVLLIPVAVLWLLALLLGISRRVADRRDQDDLVDLQDLLESKQSRSRQARELEDAIAQRDQAKRYLEAVSQPSAPYQSPEAESCREDLHAAEREIAQLQGQLSALGDPAVVDAQLDNLAEEIKTLQQEYDAIELARTVLTQADEALHARFSPKLTQRAEDYFSILTQGQYSQMFLSKDLEVSVQERGSVTPRPLAVLSQGTADALYLALRLAMTDLVLPNPTACPLVLDDALLTLDDEHLRLTLELLMELAGERQIILFTCQHRELAVCGDRADVIQLPGFNR